MTVLVALSPQLVDLWANKDQNTTRKHCCWSSDCVFKVALRLGNYELINLLLRFGANVNYYCRVNTTHFPSALQYALKDEVNWNILLKHLFNSIKLKLFLYLIWPVVCVCFCVLGGPQDAV